MSEESAVPDPSKKGAAKKTIVEFDASANTMPDALAAAFEGELSLAPASKKPRPKKQSRAANKPKSKPVPQPETKTDSEAPTKPEVIDLVSPTPSSAKLDQHQRRERQLSDGIRTVIRDAYHDLYSMDESRLSDLDLRFQLKVDPKDNWSLEFEPPLRDQVLRQLEDQEASFNTYQEGHVYCFRCDSANCACSAPPDPLQIFSRYDSMGQPEWCELTQKLLDSQHEQIDLLYRKNPPVLNLMQFGKDLKAEQLSSYGKASKTYSLLGQVIVGYLTVPKQHLAAGYDDRRLAISFQIVETRGKGGRFRLRLNTVFHRAMLKDVDDLFLSEWAPWLQRARRLAKEQLEQIEGLARRARQDKDNKRYHQQMGKVSGVLRNLSRSLSRGDRQAHRRTQHAEQRRSGKERPVNKAFEDATVVTRDKLFIDEKENTFVVTNGHGRVHIYSKEGRHVTSFFIKKENMDHRLRTKRWQKASDEDVLALHADLQKSVSDGRESDETDG